MFKMTWTVTLSDNQLEETLYVNMLRGLQGQWKSNTFHFSREQVTKHFEVNILNLK